MSYKILHVRYSEYKQAIHYVRETVFIQEQGIDASIEFDGLDINAWHVLIMKGKEAIATGRLLLDGKIGRVAVLESYRHQGLGVEVMNALIKEAKQNNLPKVYLDAQTKALSFYTNLGFTPFEKKFIKAGIEHQSMERVF